jgi:hypothetical protein
MTSPSARADVFPLAIIFGVVMHLGDLGTLRVSGLKTIWGLPPAQKINGGYFKRYLYIKLEGQR